MDTATLILVAVIKKKLLEMQWKIRLRLNLRFRLLNKRQT